MFTPSWIVFLKCVLHYNMKNNSLNSHKKYTNEIMECFNIFISLMLIHRDSLFQKQRQKNVNPGPENKLD